MIPNQTHMLEALAQNYQFKIEKPGKLPSINYVYPDYTADGNTEAFRFDCDLRRELSDRAESVRQNLEGKKVAYTSDKSTLLEVGKIAPRLGLEEQISREINSVYSSYAPLLFIGVDESNFTAYIVKPIIDTSMAWFELTQDETQSVRNMLREKAEAKPYAKPDRTWLQRIFKLT